ncbi:MAG: T9SS type A sorting domain-containing protein [Bacteroidia bacterium]|nr:T9SS type A sorting domain-containing protein [Bacteroidia bacterium]
MKNFYLFPFLLIFLFTASLPAQQFEIHPLYFSIFDADSLSGFNESEARATAIKENYLGSEFKIKMYRMKREFIKNKYGLVSNAYQTSYINAAKPSTVVGCLNNDFEGSIPGLITATNQIAGWTVLQGYNGYVDSLSDSSLIAVFPNGLNGADFCNLMGCCPMPPNASELVDCSTPGGYIDNGFGPQYPVFSVFGTGTISGAASTNTHIPQGLFGSKVIRLNNLLAGDYNITKLSKTFLVNPTSDFFQYAFASYLTPGHTLQCDATSLKILMYDHGSNASNTPTTLVCPTFTFMSNQSASPPIQYYQAYSFTPFNPSSFFGNIYHPWEIRSIDLGAYIGHYVTIEVLVADCNAGGHVGYTYFDSECRSLAINVFPSQDSTQQVCAPAATITAPEGFLSYQWTGPNGFSSSNAVFSTTTSGVYTLMINEPTLCTPISRTVGLSLSSPGQINHSTDSVICKGETAILTAAGMLNCLWNTGDQTPTIFVSPDSTSLFSVTGINTAGCPVSASFVQHVDECVGLKKEAMTSNFSFFPNPNNGEFIVSVPAEKGKYQLIILTALGQEIYHQSLLETKNSIRLKNPKPGLYLYSIKNDKGVVSTGKFKIE